MQLLRTLPIGVVVFPGSDITDNLGDKARTLGIPSGASTAAASERRSEVP